MSRHFKSAMCVINTSIGRLALGDVVGGYIQENIPGRTNPTIYGKITSITCYSKDLGNRDEFSISGLKGYNGYSQIQVRKDGFYTCNGQTKIILTIH